MSMYNMVHGTNPLAGVLMCMLNTTPDKVPRFRDCWFNGTHIVIHTRTGGGNRDFYENEESCRSNYPEYFEGENPPNGPWNDDLRALDNYVSDHDGEYDSTYADFHFSVPEQFNHLLEKLMSMVQKQNQEERWESAIERIKTASPDDPIVARMTAAFAPVFAAIEKSMEEKS